MKRFDFCSKNGVGVSVGFACILLSLFSDQLKATDYYWDADGDSTGNQVDGTNLGGSGAWDTSAFNWWDTSSEGAWPNLFSDRAIFTGTAGTVTLSGTLMAGSLVFNTDGYILTGGASLILGGAATVEVADGATVSILSDISGSSGLIKEGAGTLNLGPSNSYTGDTTINGGTLEVYKDESLGTGGGEIVLNGGTLRALGNNFYSTRDIVIGAGGGTLDVTREYSNFGTMRLRGTISGSGTLTKTGFGQLRLDGDSSGFTGAVVIDQGIVRLNAYFDRGTTSSQPYLGGSSYTLHSGADLLLVYNSLGSTPYYSAINETAPVHMEGGRIQYYSNNSGVVSPWTQNFGDLYLDGGSNRFLVGRPNSGSATLMAFGNLIHAVGSVADFRGVDGAGATMTSLGLPGNNPMITFNSIPAPVNDGILGGWATANLNDFADYDPVFGVRYATYTSNDITTAGATDNVDITEAGGTFATIGDLTINSLRWTATASTSTLEQDPGSTLTIDTGGLLMLGNFNKRIQPSSGTATIKANGGGFYIHNNQGTLTIDSIIADGDMSTALVKTQFGSLTLNGANTYTGGTYLLGGGSLTTGTTTGVTYLGTGPVYVTGGNLVQSRPGATSSTAGYFATGGGGIFVNTTQAFTSVGDRYTVDGTSVIAGPSGTGTGLNSLTYVAGAVSNGGEVHLDPGATVLHTTNSTAMGTGTNTISGLPTSMDFYFGEGFTQTATSAVTIGLGTPWKGLGTDRNTRGWDQGTITVNGFDFELHGLLVPNATGEGQSAYTFRLGNNTSGVAVTGAPTIVGSSSGALFAHVTGGITQLMDDVAVYGDTSNSSSLTFLVEAGATLDIAADTALGSGNGIASVRVLDGGTIQQFFTTTVSAANTAIMAAAGTGINGDVTVQARGRFLAQNPNGLTGSGTLTFESRSIIQINHVTGWTGAQALAAVGVNDAVVKIQVDNFGTAAQPTLTTYFDGTGIYEWGTNANAANPTSPNTVILSLDGAPGTGRGIVINDAFDRNLDSTANGFIELKSGGAGGTFASSTGQYFSIRERIELHGQTLTIGYADVIDGDPGLGDVRLQNVTSDAPGGMINVISGAQMRIDLTDAIQNDISVTLEAGAWLDVDNADSILELIGNGATSRVFGDNLLTILKTGNNNFNASLGDNARLTQAGGGTLTIVQDADGNGILGATSGTLQIGTGVSIGGSLGFGYTLNPTGVGSVIDINGTTQSIVNLTGDSNGVVELNGGTLEFLNTGTVTIASTNASINGPGTLQIAGTGSVRFNGDPTRLTNIDVLNIFNGEFRVDGVAGVADSFLIDATTVNLGDGFATTGGTGFRVFPRLFLVNTETTQTATLNMNGGWLISDLGTLTPLGVGMDIWSGNINITGAAATNLIDVNDTQTTSSNAAYRTAPEEHYISGVISGTGGFSKINSGALILTASNPISGNIYVQRGGPAGAALDAQGGLVLAGPNGALTAANSLVVSRDGSLYLDNSVDVNIDRVGDATDLILRSQGRLRIVGNASSTVSETMGDLFIDTGSAKINFDLDDTTPQLTTLTFATFKRDPGSIAQFQVLDNTPGTFGSPFSGNAQLFILDSGLTSGTAQLYGGGGINGSTNKTIVAGAFGGVNNISNHFMTFDSNFATELRPLVWDGTIVGSEYFLSREAPTLAAPHQFTRAGLVTNDQNVLINFNVDGAKDGQIGTGLGGGYGWYGAAPVAILENVAMNSLRFGTDTTTSGNNTNEIGSALVLAPGARLYLGDKAADSEIGAITTSGSGMILFGRDILGTPPGSNQYIAGGYLNFGTREALLVNESGNSAYIRSNIVGTGGLTKAGANSVFLDNSNSYSGTTTVAEGNLYLGDQNALGASTLVKLEGSGQLYLRLGTNIVNNTAGPTPPNLYVGATDASRIVLYSNDSNNTWGGDIIFDNVDNAGNYLHHGYIGTGSLYTLNINGNIYGNEEGAPIAGIAANHISTDTSLNDARLLLTQNTSLAGGVINLNGQFRDNYAGAIATPVTSDNENQLLRFFIRGSNQLVVNARQQWDAAGQIRIENGILRYEGDGNFYTDLAAANLNGANGQSGLRLGGSGSGTGISGNNNNTGDVALILTKAGQNLNIGYVDIGGDGTNNYNGFGNTMFAGTNTSGTVTFGNGTDRVAFNGSSSTNSFIRDLTVYQADGGTMELNFRLDDTDADSHTSFTKIGRGVVNFNGQNDVNGAAQNGDVEQLNMSGGLLRLTNYGEATGRRFDNGAMIVLAGGGIEMDGAGAIQNETANYTGTAVLATAGFPTAQTLVAAGGTDVIVTAAGFNITMNIGDTSLPMTRLSGGTVNFVENATGSGLARITLQGSGGGQIQADDTAYAWATYGNSYNFDAGSATYTLNAIDFAMTTGGSGQIEAFSGATREDNDDVTIWTIGSDVSENGAGFNGGLATSPVNTIHFDFDGTGSIDGTAGLEVTSGGIMVNSGVLTGMKSILNGTLMAGVGNDLIIHHYGGGTMTIGSVIQDNGGANALVKAGSGTLVLTGTNTYTGKTYLNGGALSISSDANLGTAPGSVVADAIHINGGNLDTTADFTLDANRGITLGGNGGEINVDLGTTLTYGGIIVSEANLIANYNSNPALGRLDKTGSGTLLLTNINNTFNGLLDIREGTLKWEPVFSASATVTPFGSNNAFLDGTTLHSGATLAIHANTTANNSNFNVILQEWFTFEGGSTLDINPVNTAGSPHDFNTYFRGIIKLDSLGNVGTPDGYVTPASLAGATIIANRDNVYFNDAGGYITGDGGITKYGGGNLYFRENSPEWTGQLVVLEGAVIVNSAGNPLGTGTLPIILGHNLLAEQAGEVVSGNGTVSLFFQDEGGYRDVSSITQDIIVRSDDGAGGQAKRIGAYFLANIDEVNYDGKLTLRDDVTLYYRDDTRNSAGTSTSDVPNTTRSIGTLGNQETVFINFNGDIVGAVGNDINTQIEQFGNDNVVNGSIISPFDDLVLRAIFGLNGDNSAWAGNLIVGNSVVGGDVDLQHIVTFGNPLAISAQNNVTIRSDATLRVSGNDIVIGSLSSSAANSNAFIENSSADVNGSITITQSVNATVDVVLRDGETVFILQPGESYQSLSFVKAGSALLGLTKGNSFTGTTTLAGGTLQLAYDADNSMLADGAALILNDGILDLAGSSAHTEIVGSTTLNGTVAVTRSIGTSVLDFGLINRNAGSLRIQEDYLTKTDTLNTNGIIGAWATVGGSFAVNEFNAVDNFIIGLTTFDQQIDRLAGGPGTQLIVDGATHNVNIVEAGTTDNDITLAASGTTTIYTLRQGADGSTIGSTFPFAFIDIGSGKILRIASGGVLLPDGSSSLIFRNSGTLTAGTMDNEDATLFLQSQDEDSNLNLSQKLIIGAVIADNGSGVLSVRTTGPGVTIFNGTNTYSGETNVGSGTLSIGDGNITGTLGGTADVTVEASGTLAFNRSDTALSIVNPLVGAGYVVQYGSGTTTLNAASTLSSLTYVLANGTLASGVDDAINTTGVILFGESIGASTVGDLSLAGDATVGGLIVQTNTASANTLEIALGKILTVNGDVTIGIDTTLATASSQSVLTVTGDGTWEVNKESGTFQVGGATTDTFGNRATLDMSGLANFMADLGVGGIFRVGDNAPNGGGSGNSPSTATLADTSIITAGLIGIGDARATLSGNAILNLGSVSNILNADRIAVGDNIIGRRGTGILQFADSTGTVTVRDSNGDGRAIFDVLNSAAGTGNSLTGNVADFTGHDADLLLTSLTIGSRSAGNGAGGATMSFDEGIIDVTTVTIGRKSGGGGTATTSGTLNIGGGTVIVGTGGISMGENSASDSASTGAGTLNITGGNVSVDGDIIHVGTTGGSRLSSATLNLDVGSLDMLGHNIGDSTNEVDETFASGTLANLGELNGGADLTKTTAGTLILEGDNTYTGSTVINEGTLQLGGGGSTGTMNPVSTISVASGATFAVNQDDTVTQGSEFSASAISGFGNFEQSGAGTTILTAANTYQGTTTVRDGILLVNGDQTGAIGVVTVGNGVDEFGTLGGTGIVGGETTIKTGSTLSAGDPSIVGGVGTLTFAGDLTTESGSIWLVDLVQNLDGFSDSINLSNNNLSIEGSTLTLVPTEAFTPNSGNQYIIASYGTGTLSGTFDMLADGGIVGNYYIDYGQGFNDWGTVGQITLRAVPEPGTFGLLGLALAGIIFRRIRNRRAMESQ